MIKFNYGINIENNYALLKELNDSKKAEVMFMDRNIKNIQKNKFNIILIIK